jgi:hypothetical protein
MNEKQNDIFEIEQIKKDIVALKTSFALLKIMVDRLPANTVTTIYTHSPRSYDLPDRLRYATLDDSGY